MFSQRHHETSIVLPQSVERDVVCIFFGDVAARKAQIPSGGSTGTAELLDSFGWFHAIGSGEALSLQKPRLLKWLQIREGNLSPLSHGLGTTAMCQPPLSSQVLCATPPGSLSRDLVAFLFRPGPLTKGGPRPATALYSRRWQTCAFGVRRRDEHVRLSSHASFCHSQWCT